MSNEVSCVGCDIRSREILAEKEQNIRHRREITKLEAELDEMKTAVRVLLRSVDRYRD